MGADFQDVTDQLKMEVIEMKEGSDGFHSYVSPELKKQQQFKFFNNTYMYVSFREKFIAQPGESASETKLSVRELYRTVVSEYLKNAQSNEGKLKDVDLEKLTFKQAYASHVTFTVGDQNDFKKIANNLKQREEIMAVEWLDRKKVFGHKATIEEMSAFKSKVKKQKIEYDPDKQIDYEEIKRKQEREQFDKRLEEERKKGKVRQPQPYAGAKQQPTDEL